MESSFDAEASRWYASAYHWLDMVGGDKSEGYIEDGEIRQNPDHVKVLRFLGDKVNEGDLQIVQHLHTLETHARVAGKRHSNISAELIRQRDRLTTFKGMARMMIAYGEYANHDIITL